MRTPYRNYTSIYMEGSPVTSLQAVYPCHCSYNKCTHCAFKDLNKNLYTGDDLQSEVLTLYKDRPFEHIEILTPGSFFDGFPLFVQEYIGFSLSRLSKIKRVLVESRVDLLNSNIEFFTDPLFDEGKIVEVAFGYESSDENIRNLILNKEVSEENLLYFLNFCKNMNLHAVVYIIIKPPFLSEEESIIDAVKSSIHVLNLAEQINVPCRINLEPMFVAGKYLEYLHSIQKYFPPSYTSVIKVVKKIIKEIGTPKGRIYVGTSDENLSKFHSFDLSLKNLIIEFNAKQDESIFGVLDVIE